MNTGVSQTSGLRTQLLTLRRGALVLILITGIMTVGAVLLSVRQEALFEANADVFIDTKNIGSSLADVTQSQVDPRRVLDTQAAEARVPDVIKSTLARFTGSSDSAAFLGRSKVLADPKADLLTFSVTSSDQRLAAQLANAYATAYTSYRRKRDTGALGRAQLEVKSQINDLNARGRTQSSLYATLTERNQALREREVLLGSTAILGRPARNAIQIQPHPVRNGILGMILGLCVGVGVLFIREATNTRVRTSADIEEHLGLPLLGRLYEPRKLLRSRDELSMMTEPDAPEAEAFQLLATNIEFTNLDRGAKSFMITSANPAEGKSTTIANLAVTFARSGKRVVLVDLDLRRPVVHRFFNLNVRPGITEVALGRAWLDEALVRVALGHKETDGNDPATHEPLGGTLEVLPAGPLPPNASEFVRSQALADVLDRLEERADLVLVDAPAMLAVSDAINLTPKVDALIVLTKLTTVRRPALEELRRILDNAPVAKVGFVLTGADADESFMGSYAYGYGYGAEESRHAAPLS